MAGSAASSISIEGEETINELLSEEALIARMNMEVL
jgi:hypothetical protein